MTPAQLEANKRNAKRSTGPRTPEGKAVVSMNAIRHGIFSRIAVLPGVEDQAEWEEHLRRIGEDLGPGGYLHGLMAERIAGILWRMARAARWERELIAVELEEAEGPEKAWRKEHLAELQERLEKARDLIPRFAEMEDAAPVSPPDAWAIIEEANDVIDFEAGEGEEEECLGREWTAGDLRAYLEELAEEAEEETTWKAIQRQITEELEEAIQGIRRDMDREAVDANRKRRITLLPDAAAVEKLLRYEASLERSLYRSLRELSRLREGRAVEIPGGFVPPNPEGAT